TIVLVADFLKMNRSRQLHAPIITFLSPSLTASKKATSLLSVLGNFDNVSVVTDDYTHLSTGFSRYSWDSVGEKFVLKKLCFSMLLL
ncbi:MAG: hypothetical protein ACI8RD_010707, partial [Bacillariaceae sp.]